ncbi:uncharacterized protein LOC123471012 [Daphnia magna]|uniref:uncharacterized protein LOC123471012 n=1 Tax=Daphnia magna TaxID=35525 RepID=UPI001E1BA5DF|nr:uncharacterized protein LOC123471012 [Daphnia magna]
MERDGSRCCGTRYHISADGDGLLHRNFRLQFQNRPCQILRNSGGIVANTLIGQMNNQICLNQNLVLVERLADTFGTATLAIIIEDVLESDVALSTNKKEQSLVQKPEASQSISDRVQLYTNIFGWRCGRMPCIAKLQLTENSSICDV